MDYMTDKQILEIIEFYLNSNIYNYAVLLDGTWGSGKTYFIKNSVIPFIEENENSMDSQDYKPKHPIYISLNGLTSETDISTQIYINILSHKRSNGINKITNIGIKIISDIFSNKGIKIENLHETLSEIIDFDNYIFIFDDLERCNMDINNLLGYINNFVEHDGIKTIIVANQDEIGKANSYSNLELKYIVAAHPHIKFEKTKSEATKRNILGESTYNSSDSPSIKTIKERTNEIFNQNVLYTKIKEKLIGTTIKYSPNLVEIIPKVVEGYSSVQNQYSKIIVDEIPFIISLFNDKYHNNLRTLQLGINCYFNVVQCIKDSDIKEQRKTIVLRDIFQYTMFSAVKFNSGYPMYKWENNQERAHVSYSFEDEIFSMYGLDGFRFIDELIYYSYLDSDRVRTVIASYFFEKQKAAMLQNDPYRSLDNWWELEDGFVESNINQINKNLEHDLYSITLYPRLIMRLANIIYAGFSRNYINHMEESMVKNIRNFDKKSKLSLDYSDFGSALNKEIGEIYSENIKIIKNEIQKHNDQLDNDVLQSVISADELWGQKLYDFCKQNRSKFTFDKNFFSKIDIHNLILKIESSNSINIAKCRFAISGVYDFSNLHEYFMNDLPNLEAFHDMLLNIDSTNIGKIKNFNLILLKELINETIKKIKQIE